jgi:hypothetical protein
MIDILKLPICLSRFIIVKLLIGPIKFILDNLKLSIGLNRPIINILKHTVGLNKFILDILKPSTGLYRIMIDILTLPIDCEVLDSQIWSLKLIK